MSRQNLAWLLSVTAISLFALALISSASGTQEKDKRYKQIKRVVDTLDAVENNYVEEVDLDKLVDDMLNGGLERLDPHSSYINAKDYKQFQRQSKGKFGGIGIHIGYDRQNRGQLTVISPMPGTPAYEAGVLAGDAILKIDDKSTEGMRLDEAVDLIQGDPGQKIKLTVRHEGTTEPVDIEIVRAEIQVASVLGDQRKTDNLKEWDFVYDKTNRIAYIRLTNFSETATREMKAAIGELKQAGMKGLVLDLRNNPGGLLKAAVEISNLFIPEGRIVSTKGRNHKEESYDARIDDVMLPPDDGVKVAVLINGYSASASEIVSAALQDHKRAIIVGERSYGKGSVQNIIQMEKNTTALKLTTATYWRPSGKNIHRRPNDPPTAEWGVTPDIKVELTDEERLEYMRWRNDRDVVRKNGQGEKKDDKKEEKKDFKDKVLEEALKHLREEIKKPKAQGPLPVRGQA